MEGKGCTIAQVGYHCGGTLQFCLIYPWLPFIGEEEGILYGLRCSVKGLKIGSVDVMSLVNVNIRVHANDDSDAG